MARAEPSRIDDELRSFARGDAGRYQLLRDSLGRLADGAAGPALQEMAREVLAGRVTPRQAMLSSAYAEAWRPHAERLIRGHDQLLRDKAQAGEVPG